MAHSLIPIPSHYVRSAITLKEAYRLLEEADPRSPAKDQFDQNDIWRVARSWLAALVLHDQVSCFVWSSSEGWFRIPRQHWWKSDWSYDELINRVGLNPVFDYEGVLEAPHDLNGQEIAVWREDLEVLIADNRKPLPGATSSPMARAGSSSEQPVTDPADVPAEGIPPIGRRGRRPKYDWEAMTAALLREADLNGLDDKTILADWERWAADWLTDKYGEPPATSTIRERISPIFIKFAALRS